jgi:hypothetical protein
MNLIDEINAKYAEQAALQRQPEPVISAQQQALNEVNAKYVKAGDLPGHKFHGNQYTGTDGMSEEATAQHKKNIENYESAIAKQKAEKNKWNPAPKPVAPGTHMRMADEAIAKAKATLKTDTVTLGDHPEFHTDAAKLAGMENIAGTKVRSKIAASVDLSSTGSEILKLGRAGGKHGTPHPDAVLAWRKIVDSPEYKLANE